MLPLVIDCSNLLIDDDSSNHAMNSNECASKQTSLTSSTDMSSNNDDDESMRVRFSSVKIREYDIILGDNPSSQYGPPVTIDWEYNEMPSLSLDQYEDNRAPRRTHRQMFINGRYRAQILINSAGHTEDEILKAENDCKKVQKQRNATRRMLPFSKVEEVTQSAGRKLRRLKSKNI